MSPPQCYFTLKKQLSQLIKKKREEFINNGKVTISNYPPKSQTILCHRVWFLSQGWPRSEHYRPRGLAQPFSNSILWASIPCLEDLPAWPPVSPEEVRESVCKLRSGKVLGPDMMSGELLNTDPNICAPLLAALFMMVDRIMTKCNCGSNLKRENRLALNCRPISLLSILSKLYAKHLLSKLTLWISNQDSRARKSGVTAG